MIRHFTGSGISITAGGTTGVMITRTTVFSNGNGNGTTGAGVRIAPASGGTSTGMIDRVVAIRNTLGLAGDATGGNVGLNINESTATNDTLAGIIATGGTSSLNVMVLHSTASNNSIGIQNTGGNISVRIGQNAIQGNTTRVSVAVSSYTTNQLEGNGTNGTVTPDP